MPIHAAGGRNVERIGHRGAPRRYRENTLPSFAQALELGADAVELDVHVTRDGQVVVHHDPDLSGSVQPAALRKRALSDLTLTEATAVDLGSGARIPTLSEVLALTRGKAFTYVEVKAGDIDAVVAVIRASQADCAIHSFDHAAVAAAWAAAPEIPRGALLDSWPASLTEVLRQTGARDVWPRVSLVTRDRVEQIRAAGCRTIVWTVNDAVRAKELVDFGVDGLCSDDITLL